MKIKSLKGTQDILPAQIPIWRHIEKESRRIFDLYGYRELRTPIIEEKGLFLRSIGEETDIVGKQMYAFNDQGGRDICLRPEETAPVARAYLENQLDKTEGFVKLFYIGPMFRCERPQSGRLRQFHQVGVEAIGSYSPYLDAEVIILLNDLLKAFGLSNYIFYINTLGCDEDRKAIKAKLKEVLSGNIKELCDDCRKRYNTNILRILDCKNSTCRNVIYNFSAHLQSAFSDDSAGLYCQNCINDFRSLRNILDEAGVTYQYSTLIVRGLDYYTKTVFEVTAKGLGAQNAIAAGGRYNNLISDLAGSNTSKIGACGFALGVERVIEVLSKTPKHVTEKKREIVFIAVLGEEARKQGFKILTELRKNKIAADIDYQGKDSLKAQMRYADKIGAAKVIIIGEDELKSDTAVIKNMVDGSQRTVALSGIVGELKTNDL